MNTSTTHSVPVFSKTSSPSTKHFNNWFNGNTTNFGSKSFSSLNFSDKNIESKLFNGWFSGNTTNFNIKK